MRNGTKSFIGVVSLGLVAAGYQAGLAAEIGNGFSSTPVTNSASGVTTGATAPTGGVSTGTSAGSETLNTAAPTASAAPTTSSTPATSSAPASKPKASSAAAAPASTPAATTSTSPAPVSTPKATTAPAPAATGTTKTGSAINYRYGTVQVSVTKANGKITAVNLLQAGATGGRQGAFSYLVDYAIQANGSSFGNLGGATFTTEAFKQSLESALAKF